MSAPHFRLLAWDSDFLGLPVALLEPGLENAQSVTRALSELRDAGVRLAYWKPRHDQARTDIAKGAGAGFLGTHVRFECAPTADVDGGVCLDVPIAVCDASSAELEALAVAAGAGSRFALDPAMPPDAAARLYTRWLRESFGGAMGDEVLVARDAQGMAGLVTLKHGAEGVVGLVAVAQRCRGRGLGRSLVHAATQRFAALGSRRVSVVTQGDNLAAQRLYRSCGYSPAESLLTAHFWL